MRLVATVALVLVLCVAGGCGKKVSDMVAEKATEKVIESAMAKEGQEADVKIDSQSGSMTIQTKDGDKTQTVTTSNYGYSMKSEDGQSMTIGKDAKVPEGFPKDVPIYTGLELQMSSADPASSTFSLQGSTADAMDKVAAFYKEQMKSQGWTEAQAVSQSGDNAMQMLNYEKAEMMAMIMVTNENGKTMVSITAAKQ